jgi:hypothetical protein
VSSAAGSSVRFKGAYRDAIRSVRPILPIPEPMRPQPTTREAALVRLGELEQVLITGEKSRRKPAAAEKMAIQALLATSLRRRPTPKREARPPFETPNEAIPYAGPRCGFCGGAAPGGVCVNLGVDWPHP